MTVRLYIGRAGFVFRYWFSRVFVLFKVFSGFSMSGGGPYHSKYSQNFGMFRLAHQLVCVCVCVLNPYTCTLFYMYPYKMLVACTAGRNASCVVGVIRLVHAEALSGVAMARNRCRLFSRGTTLVLLMGGLLNAAHWLMYLAIAFSLPDNLKFILKYVLVAPCVLLPVTGWVAESWLGRYRAIAVGLVLSSVAILTVQAAFIMLQFDWTPIPAFGLVVVGLVILGTFGIGSIYTIMLPFALDQMIGASAEELSAAVQWYCWGIIVGNLFEDILQCVPIPNQLQSWEILQIISLTIGTLCLSAALIMDCLYHKWLDTNNKTGNPIKLIYQVLNYARKNKCPRLRSALTYIDKEHPSRLDFGKHKFGGPFTEEECWICSLLYWRMYVKCTAKSRALVLSSIVEHLIDQLDGIASFVVSV